MKKVLIGVLGVSFLLTGCFGASDSEDSPQDAVIAGYTMYQNDDFFIQVPEEWETLTQVQFKSSTPENTVVGFRNNIRDPKFTANVVVVKNELGENPPSTLDYAKSLYQYISDALGNARRLETGEADIYIHGTPTKSLFIYMEGAEKPDSDIKRFMQFSGINSDGTAFTATGSFLATDTDMTAERVETAVKSFGLK